MPKFHKTLRKASRNSQMSRLNLEYWVQFGAPQSKRGKIQGKTTEMMKGLEHLLRGEAEGVGIAQPGKEKAQGIFSISINTRGESAKTPRSFSAQKKSFPNIGNCILSMKVTNAGTGPSPCSSFLLSQKLRKIFTQVQWTLHLWCFAF